MRNKTKLKILALLTALLVISLVSKHIDNQKAISGQFCGLHGFSSKWCQLKWVAEREPNRLPVSKDSDSLINMLLQVAQDKGIDGQDLIRLAKCESSMDSSAIGDQFMPKPSAGLFQISLHYHPDITMEQALDPEWSANWAGDMIAKGYSHRWSCSRKLALFR